jgi:hypothetical protein
MFAADSPRYDYRVSLVLGASRLLPPFKGHKWDPAPARALGDARPGLRAESGARQIPRHGIVPSRRRPSARRIDVRWSIGQRTRGGTRIQRRRRLTTQPLANRCTSGEKYGPARAIRGDLALASRRASLTGSRRGGAIPLHSGPLRSVRGMVRPGLADDYRRSPPSNQAWPRISGGSDVEPIAHA